MNRNEIKLKFDSISGNSQYVRVSDNHPLELYLGKNERGYLTLRFNGQFVPVKVLGNSLLEIKQFKATDHNSILFSFNSQENLSLFYNFCEDLINQTENYHGNNGYVEIVNRYNQWRKMFYGSSKLLSENEIMGLIGELSFLSTVSFEKYGQTTGLNGWSGPEPTHKDFSYDNEWFEIKTVNSSKNSVMISSIEQLDSEVDGKLVVYELEKMSPSFNGVSLNALITKIMGMLILDSDRDILSEKLKQVGYAFNDYYDNFVYNLKHFEFYNVVDGFPRLKASDLPQGIGRVQYEIILSNIEKYKEK